MLSFHHNHSVQGAEIFYIKVCIVDNALTMAKVLKGKKKFSKGPKCLSVQNFKMIKVLNVAIVHKWPKYSKISMALFYL